jgi:hypothetical protein
MLKIILTGKSLIQLNFIVNIHITYNALTLILFIVLRMLIIHYLSIDVQNPLKAALLRTARYERHLQCYRAMNYLFDFAFDLSCLLLPYYF